MISFTMVEPFSFYATCPRYLEDLLRTEIEHFGAHDIKVLPSGVSFSGTIEIGYTVCLWSRIANRVFLILATAEGIDTKEAFITFIEGIPFHEHVSETGTIWIESSIVNGFLNNSVYASQLTKDIIADSFMRRFHVRPSVDNEKPDLRLRLSLRKDHCSLSIDLAGESLHRRGYRKEAGPATLKENVAAAILLRAHWPSIAQSGGPCVDPMCGTGTLLIEAGLIAGDVAPGLFRDSFGFFTWRGHNPEVWKRLVSEAKERRALGEARVPQLVGFDSDPQAVAAAQMNSTAAGFAGKIIIEQRSIEDAEPPEGKPGLVVTNPPYGVRLMPSTRTGTEGLSAIYSSLGNTLTTRFGGYRAAIITGDEELAFQTGLKAFKVNRLYNGSIPCILALFDIFTEEKRAHVRSEIVQHREKKEVSLSPHAEMLRNRLKRNARLLKGWLSREGITCYRLYDADIPEYSAAIDIYEGMNRRTLDTERYAVVQEYAAPQEIDPHKALHRFEEIITVTGLVTGIESGHIIRKTRMKQRGKSQYEKLDQRGVYTEITEGGLHFLVNFTDYLDTGIFLDHRTTRKLIMDEARGRHFLNLFGYTGTATVYAAKGGALTTTTVDTSSTYLEWARKNLERNGIPEAGHLFINADAMEFLSHDTRQYGLIFCDPPTFSNSKDRTTTFDVQRDHAALIRLAVSRLSQDGVLIFSTNLKKFSLKESEIGPCLVEDITALTIPKDFERNQKIHRCYKITRERS
ncbi:MAG TPA: bifunctional 23S rRNA (guanine(2069)-N(7))-methyltransferase RlmK/23S rRNA (guanine(2445)-N(2))-methyltransferase RlmL [Spirochaetia bacterium]|nr:bifunctional 23S rRNA (guanine(2069)-N(7))-methyltransferase RlmK/23S rRNA (guanine(2445)-N(2))-methyltransferase RlmL [Spirochaetia bacterium]